MTTAAPVPASIPALRIDNVSYSYGSRQVLHDVSFSVPRGNVTILLGPNGAGKSTLFSLIVSLLGLQRGEIGVHGHSVRADRVSALAAMGLVFQQPTLDPDLTVWRNLQYFARLRGLSARAARERIERELARFDVLDRRDHPVRDLNGGHRRRVEIARATLHDPRVLLLDEPTVGLDIPSRKALVEDLHRRVQDGVAVLWATHLIDEVWPEDSVVVLHRGRIRAAGTVAEIAALTGSGDLDSAFTVLTQDGATA